MSSHQLVFETGIPIFDGRPELLEEYLDRVETLEISHTEDVQKKQGPLAPKLYNALRGEAYLAVKAANIEKTKLATTEGVKLLKDALKAQIRGTGPNRVGEIFDMYFESGNRRPTEAVNPWLTKRSETRQQLLAADPSTTLSENIEAYFLLKLSGLTKAQRSQALASCGNTYDPKTPGEAMRVQFADLHKTEGRYRERDQRDRNREKEVQLRVRG